MSYYPQGKLNDSDEGELDVTIGIENSAIVLNFRKSVTWIGLGAEEARQLADLLLKNAIELEKQKKPEPNGGQ